MIHSHEMLEYPGVDENKERNLDRQKIASMQEQMVRDAKQRENRSDYQRLLDRLDGYNRYNVNAKSPEAESVEGDEIEKSGGLLSLNREQVGRVLGLHDYNELDQLDKSGSIPLKGGAKLYLREDGTCVVAGYSADYSDVRKIKDWLEEGLQDFVL